MVVGVTLRLKPISWYGYIAVFLAVPCVLLDVYRGAVAISMSSLEVSKSRFYLDFLLWIYVIFMKILNNFSFSEGGDE